MAVEESEAETKGFRLRKWLRSFWETAMLLVACTLEGPKALLAVTAILAVVLSVRAIIVGERPAGGHSDNVAGQ